MTGIRQPPGAALDSQPWAASWAAFLRAVSDPEDKAGARRVISDAERLGLDLDGVTDTLVVEGVASFSKAFDDLLGAIAPTGPARATSSTARGSPLRVEVLPTRSQPWIEKASESSMRGRV